MITLQNAGNHHPESAGSDRNARDSVKADFEWMVAVWGAGTVYLQTTIALPAPEPIFAFRWRNKNQPCLTNRPNPKKYITIDAQGMKSSNHIPPNKLCEQLAFKRF